MQVVEVSELAQFRLNSTLLSHKPTDAYFGDGRAYVDGGGSRRGIARVQRDHVASRVLALVRAGTQFHQETEQFAQITAQFGRDVEKRTQRLAVGHNRNRLSLSRIGSGRFGFGTLVHVHFLIGIVVVRIHWVCCCCCCGAWRWWNERQHTARLRLIAKYVVFDALQIGFVELERARIRRGQLLNQRGQLVVQLFVGIVDKWLLQDLELLQLKQLLLLLFVVAQPQEHGTLPYRVLVRLAQLFQHFDALLGAPFVYGQIAHFVLVYFAQCDQQVDDGMH